MRRLCLLSCLPLSAILCLAQNPEKKSEIVPIPKGKMPVSAVIPTVKAPSDYKDEALVYEFLSRTYTYAADGTGEKRIVAVMRMQSDAAVKQFSITSIPFASSNEKVAVHAVRVRHPDGTTVETPATDGMEMPQPVSQQAPFYSDLKMMQIPVRGMRAGDTLEYDVSILRTSSEAPNEFWGNRIAGEDRCGLEGDH